MLIWQGETSIMPYQLSYNMCVIEDCVFWWNYSNIKENKFYRELTRNFLWHRKRIITDYKVAYYKIRNIIIFPSFAYFSYLKRDKEQGNLLSIWLANFQRRQRTKSIVTLLNISHHPVMWEVIKWGDNYDNLCWAAPHGQAQTII